MIVKPSFVIIGANGIGANGIGANGIGPNEKCLNEEELLSSEWAFIYNTLHQYCSYSGKNWFHIWWNGYAEETNIIHIDLVGKGSNGNLICLQNSLRHFYRKKDATTALIFEIIDNKEIIDIPKKNKLSNILNLGCCFKSTMV